jgi:hypothetical protein
MSDTGSPVVILFLIVIGVLVYNFIIDTNTNDLELREIINTQQLLIQEKDRQIKQLNAANNFLFMEMYSPKPPAPINNINPLH